MTTPRKTTEMKTSQTERESAWKRDRQLGNFGGFAGDAVLGTNHRATAAVTRPKGMNTQVICRVPQNSSRLTTSGANAMPIAPPLE